MIEIKPYRYRSTAYGAGVYSGAAYDTNDAVLALEVDWDEDGLFDGRNEAGYLLPSGVNLERGREFYLNGSGSGFEHMGAGRMTVFLLNEDGTYDPRNPSSPLYPNVAPGKKCRFAVYVQGVPYYLFAGIIDDLTPCKRDGIRAVKLGIVDGVGVLKAQKVLMPVQENVKAHTMIQSMLDSVGWSALYGTDLQVGVEFIQFYWSDGGEVLDQINDLADSELGFFYFAGSGQAVYKNRYDSSSQPFATITDGDIASEPIIRMPWEVLRNRVVVKANPMVKQSAAPLWSLSGTTMRVGPGGTVTFWVDFRYNSKTVAALNVVTPTGADLVANTLPDGTGTNVSANITPTLTVFGQRAKVTLTNSYANDAYIRTLVIRGQPIEAPAPFAVEATTGKGDRVFEVDLRWQADINSAISLADLLISSMSQDNPYPVIELRDRPDIQFAIDIGTYLALDLVKSNIAGTYRVTKVKHELENRRVWSSVYWLEPYQRGSSDMWKFPTTLGVLSKFAY